VVEVTFVDDEMGGEPACSAHLFDTDGEPDDRQLAQLVRELADAVIVCDLDGRITFWNRAAETLFGWTAVEAAGKDLSLVMTADMSGMGRTAEPLRAAATHRDGSQLTVLLTLTELCATGQRLPIGMAAVVRRDTA
jgi:PAS domain S-box-containing protein